MQADRSEVARLLKTARGQIDGIIRMVEDDRYCIDIANQIMATQAILSKTNKLVLSASALSTMSIAFAYCFSCMFSVAL